MSTTLPTDPSSRPPLVQPEWLRLVRRYVDELRYGQVVLTVHQGEVIQVERTERVRFEARRKAGT